MSQSVASFNPHGEHRILPGGRMVPETRMRLIFALHLLASILAAQSQPVLAALATGNYFPLDVGDRWVFRIDSRAVTASYQTWRVDRTQDLGGKTWSVFAIEESGRLLGESYFRADGQGRIYNLTGTGELLFLDPAATPGPGTVLQVTDRIASVPTALGAFPDALSYRNRIDPLILETGTLVRGIGVVASRQDMMSGSSGGFYQSRALVEAWIAGGLQFSLDAPSLQLGLESLTLDVGGKRVTNCTVPCYFVACGMVSGANPPGTYKPCARMRVQLGNWPSGASRSVRLQLVAADGTAAFDSTVTLDADPHDSVMFVQLPLYSAPNQPLPAGAYQLLASTGGGIAQSSLTLQIQ